MYNPAILRHLEPMSVCGDGNCLYRGVSRALTVSASISKPIRFYYPPQLQAELASQHFSRKVVGMSVHRSASPTACVMWTRMSAPERTKGFIPQSLCTSCI
ncbi:hypothetical protein ACJMK2_035424 [Sinanodonta woodiana]|uniref:OTU domain-containing protein n=1 Tax=Sinanodonta woodiana TaxID=1069815 RepID=A0ABD3WYC6_SINWO